MRFAQPRVYFPDSILPDGYSRKGRRYLEIDAAANELFAKVASRGWDIPGINVTAQTYASNTAPIMVVSEISGGKPGSKWRLHFGRPEATNHNWNLTTAVNNVAISKQVFDIYDDGSGPSLKVYAGRDYILDEDRFITSFGVNSKLNREPKTYLRYKSNHSDIMIHDDDLGREYSPDFTKGEKAAIPKSEMFGNAVQFLRGVTEEIDHLPHFKSLRPDFIGDASDLLREMAHIDIIPAPSSMPILFVHERYPYDDERTVIACKGWRLCSLDVNNDPANPFPEKAYDGFGYGYQDMGQMAASMLDKQYDARIFAVSLKYANDVYVVDEGTPYETTRPEIARTMVSLIDYKGGYQSPVYLINRPLDETEAMEVDAQRILSAGSSPIGKPADYIRRLSLA